MQNSQKTFSLEERLCRKLLLNKILLTVTLSSYAKKKSFYMTLTATQTNCRPRRKRTGALVMASIAKADEADDDGEG